MQIVRAHDYDDMSKKAADFIAEVMAAKKPCVLGLATGSTPIGTYEQLAAKHKAGELDFADTVTYNLDEYRGLTHDDPQSYHYFMQEQLFSKVNIKAENTHVPDGANVDAEAACNSYDEMVAKAGYPDVQLLGIGRNGHIGFNEPADEFVAGTHCVDLTESTIQANARLFEREEDVPRQAYTMGIGTIMHAKKILILASGEDKAQAIHEMIEGAITPQCPASVLQLHPDVTVIADEAALSACAK